MTAQISTAFNTLPSLPQILSNYGPSVFNTLIVVSTISGQSLINKLAFTCPCSHPLNEYLSYGFIFGPSVALFLLGILINEKTWRLVQGCCYRTKSTQHPLSTSLLYWLEIVSQSLIAPIAWTFVSLLEGSYYKCLMASHYCQDVQNCSSSSQPICGSCVCNVEKTIADKLVSESQFLAWLLLVSTGIIASIVMCCVRIFSKFTYSQFNYVELYRDVEQKIFDDLAKENASNNARESASRFFNSKRLFKIDWDAISALPEVENPYVFLSNMVSKTKTAPVTDQQWQYTTLQKWNQERCTDEQPNTENIVEIG